MAAPGFGFSVGDVVSLITFVNKAKKALLNTEDASDEYRSTIDDFEFFQHTLRKLQDLTISHSDDPVLQEYAQGCLRPIAAFLHEIRKYEPALVPKKGSGKTIKTFIRKAPNQLKWALYAKENASKVRMEVMPRLAVITTHIVLANGQDVLRLNETLQTASRAIHRVTDTEMMRLPGYTPTFTPTATSQTIVKSTRQGDSAPLLQITLRREALASDETLETIVNLLTYIWQILSAIVMITRILPRSPTTLLDSNIHIRDVLGRSISLSFDDFRYWPTLAARLDIHFKDCPGSLQVSDQEFVLLIFTKGTRRIFDRESWAKGVFPGAKLAMATFTLTSGRKIGECPRCGSSHRLWVECEWVCQSCAFRYTLSFRNLPSDVEEDKSFGALPIDIDDFYLDDLEWHTSGNADMVIEERDIGALNMVQLFAGHCDVCQRLFTSVPKLLEHSELAEKGGCQQPEGW